MARGIMFKFLAILLASALLLVTLASGAAVVGLAASGLYSVSVQELQNEQLSIMDNDRRSAVVELALSGLEGNIHVCTSLLHNGKIIARRLNGCQSGVPFVLN